MPVKTCYIKLKMEGIPKYQHVLESLQKGILTGRLKPGEKLPGEARLVKEFGASRITVGRAVRELQRRGLVERRAGSGTFVRGARESAPGKKTFGLLIPHLGETEIFEPICQGIASATRSGEHALLWGQSDAAGEREEALWALCRQYVERRVDGVFFAPLEGGAADESLNAAVAEALTGQGIAVVLLDRCYRPFPSRSHADLVGLDNRRAGFLMTRHLIELGHRRVAFLAKPWSASSVDARIAGYREAVMTAGSLPAPGLVARLDPAGVEAVASWIRAEEPTAILCANDRTAGVLMHTLRTLGAGIPEDVAVAGMDDAGYAALLPVPLTTYRQPCRDIGRVALVAMLERLNGPRMPPRDILLGGEIVVRASCGASPAAPKTSGATKG